MAIKKHSIIAISVVSVLILGMVFWQQEQDQIQARRHLASTHVGDATNTIREALGANFIISQEQTIKTGCKEKSPAFSFTRLYDCNATAKIQLSSIQAISATDMVALIGTALGRLGAIPTNPEEMESYVQNMDETGFWKTARPIDIPNTAIAGVPPFDYYGGVGQENIGLELESEIDQNDPKKTTISVTATQEYHSCKNFFLPCAINIESS